MPLLPPRSPKCCRRPGRSHARCFSVVLPPCAVQRRSRSLHGVRRPWRVPDAVVAQVGRPGDGEAGGGPGAAPAGMRVKHLPPLALDAACPPGYPAAAPPAAALSAPWLSARAAAALEAGLAAVWAEQGPGAPVGFSWASWLAAEALACLGVADTLTLPAGGAPAGAGAHDPTPTRAPAAPADPAPGGPPARAPPAGAPAGGPGQGGGCGQQSGAVASDAAAGAASASGGPGPPGCSLPGAERGAAPADEPASVSACDAKSRAGALRACNPGGGGRAALQPHRRPRGRGPSRGGDGGGSGGGGDGCGTLAARAPGAAAPAPGRACSASPHRAPGQAGLRASAAAFTPGAAPSRRDCNGSAGAGCSTAALTGGACPAAGPRFSPAAAQSGGRAGGSGGRRVVGREPDGGGSCIAPAGSGSASAELPMSGPAALAKDAGARGAEAEDRAKGSQLGARVPSTAPCEVPPRESGGEEGDAGGPAGGSGAGGDAAESAEEMALVLLRYSAAREFQLWQEARRPCEHARGAGLCCMPRPSCAACGGAACAPAP
jgi:hypothetical protein